MEPIDDYMGELSELIREEVDRIILEQLGRLPEENKKMHNWYYKI